MSRIQTYYEISEAPLPNGRRRVKVSLHEIYPDNTKWNLNGISYIEKYVEENGKSIIGMSLCAAFLDEDKDVPYDHGMTGTDGAMPLFENSVMIGVCDGWSIEDLVIEGETHRVCMAEGYINQQRYPAFVKWLENRVADGLPVYGSVEFVGTEKNGEIIYEDGWKEEGRVPMVYDYSGYCFLTVKPSDDTAMLVEINQKQGQEDDTEMDIQELSNKIDGLVSRLDQVGELEKTVETNEATIVELNATVAQLTAALEEARKEVQTKYDEITALYEEQDMLRKEIAKAKMEARIGELNAALVDYTDEQKEYAKQEIDDFKADITKVEINSIVDKIDATIHRKMKEAHAAEINSQRDAFKLDDIFAPIDPTDEKEEVVDFQNLFC